jgi:dephospho-CoA kinase
LRVIALTGSIGMGKSTTAAMFAERGIPLHDADAAVHRLYRGKAVGKIEAAFPGTTDESGVDRAKLSGRVLGDAEALARLEAIVHPLVRESENDFLARNQEAGSRLVLIDVPLLFEAGQASRADVIVLATADPETQRRRVIARPGMTGAKFEAILARQLPDRVKRRMAHFFVDTGRGFASAERQVAAILRSLAFCG